MILPSIGDPWNFLFFSQQETLQEFDASLAVEAAGGTGNAANPWSSWRSLFGGLSQPGMMLWIETFWGNHIFQLIFTWWINWAFLSGDVILNSYVDYMCKKTHVVFHSPKWLSGLLSSMLFCSKPVDSRGALSYGGAYRGFRDCWFRCHPAVKRGAQKMFKVYVCYDHLSLVTCLTSFIFQCHWTLDFWWLVNIWKNLVAAFEWSILWLVPHYNGPKNKWITGVE